MKGSGGLVNCKEQTINENSIYRLQCLFFNYNCTFILDSTMEEIISRFRHIPMKIFEYIDNKSLSKCRKVSTAWQIFIDKEKEILIRKIQNLTNCSKTLEKTILQKKNVAHLFACFSRIRSWNRFVDLFKKYFSLPLKYSRHHSI